MNSYGLEMLKAGTNLSTKSEAELIDLDANHFQWVHTICVLLK